MLQGIPYRRIALAGFLIATVLAGDRRGPAFAGHGIEPDHRQRLPHPRLHRHRDRRPGQHSGAILGSVLIAVIESLGGYYFDPTWATITMFALTMFVLLVRPKGILGNG